MIKKEKYNQMKKDSVQAIREAGIVICDKDIAKMDVADFGLSDIDVEGAQILPLFDTEKVAARVIVQFKYQTEPEHWHESVGNIPGKEETLRVIKGQLLVFIEGRDTIKYGKIPKSNAKYYTCRHEILLNPCDTITFQPGEKHWFQALTDVCVFYTMSTTAIDANDPFTNPNMVRKTVII